MTPSDSHTWCLMMSLSRTLLVIFLHGPESTHKNGIVKTFTHTAIPIRPCTLLKQRAKPNTTPSFTGPLPVQCGGGRRSGSLADSPQDCSTSEAFCVCVCINKKIVQTRDVIDDVYGLVTEALTARCDGDVVSTHCIL